MILGMYHKHIPVDLILFADPGGEQPHTYAYLPIMNDWLSGTDCRRFRPSPTGIKTGTG